MKILRVKKTSMFDIFLGQGWEKWSRYYIHGDSVSHLGGEKLPHHLVEVVKEEVKK